MARNYLHTIFSDGARAMQERHGSRAAYARAEEGADGTADPVGDREAAFIAARDSFYIASVTPTGWPYMQHRGGPSGFLKHLGGNRIGFADYRGNRQYISASNLAEDPRVALFLIDYPARERLKLLGHAHSVELADDPALVASLMPAGYRATAERALLVDVVGWEWNCSQHIVPRFTEDQIAAAVRPMAAELNHLRAEVEALRAAASGEAQ